MSNIWKRSLSLVLALVMVFGMLPVHVFAAETGQDAEEPAAVETPVAGEPVDNDEPADEPENPADEPEDPADEPEDPADEPEDPADEPENSADEPEDSADEPEDSADEPEESADESEEPVEDEAVAAVQAMIDALPTVVNTEEEALALEDQIVAVDDAMAELYTEQLEQLDYTNYSAARDALDAWWNEDHSQEELAAGDVLAQNESKGIYLIERADSDYEYLDILNGSVASIDLYNVLKQYSDFYGETTADSLVHISSNFPTKIDYYRGGYKLMHTVGSTSTGLAWIAASYSTGASNPDPLGIQDKTQYGVQYNTNNTGSYGYNGSARGFYARYYYIPTLTVMVDSVPATNTGVTLSATGAEHRVSGAAYIDDTITITIPEAYKGYNVTITNTSGNVNEDGTITVAKKGDTEITVSLSQEKQDPATIEFVTSGNGTVSLGNLTTDGDINAGTYNLTVTPTDWSTAKNYVASVKVNDAEITNGTDGFANGTFTYSLEVKPGEKYTIEATFAERTMVLKDLSNGIGINDYSTTTRLNSYKSNLVGSAFVTVTPDIGDTNVEMYGSTVITGSDGLIDVDDLAEWHVVTLVDPVPVSKSFKITSAGNARYPAVTVDNVTVQLVESRTAPDISKETINVTADTEEDFFAAVKAVVVERLNNPGITADDISVSIKGDVSYAGTGSYTVEVKVTNAGETWIASTTATEVLVTATVNKYTVTWDADNGTDNTTETLDYGAAISAPTDPIKTSVDKVYTFSHWEDGNGEKLTDTATVSGNVTYKAVYISVTREYTISWDTDGDGDVDKTTPVPYGENPASYAPDHAAKEDYSPNGWSPAFATVTGEATYTAQYTKDTVYTVKYIVDGEVYAVQYVNVTQGEKVAAVADPDKDYAVFNGWTDSWVIGIAPTRDMELVAQWLADANNNNVADSDETVTIHASATGNGTISISGAIETDGGYVYDSANAGGNVITITATSRDTVDTDGSVDVLTSITVNGTAIEGTTFAVEDGTTYTVVATFTNYKLEAADGIIYINGALTNYGDIANGLKDKVLTAANLAADGNYTVICQGTISKYDLDSLSTADKYAVGTVLLTALNNAGTVSFNIKDNNTGVSKEVAMSVQESRQAANIQLTYVNDTKFDTEDEFKSAVEESITVNGEKYTLSTLLTDSISYVKNEDGSYNVTIKVHGTDDYVATEKTFEGITWIVNQYTVTFKDENGTVLLAAKSYEYGTAADDIEKPAEPTKESSASADYTFAGWDADDNGVADTIGMVKGDVTYTAVYTESVRKYTISWDTDADGAADDSTEVAYGTKPTHDAPEAPENTAFAGWKDAAGTLYEADLPEVTGETTYTAVFTIDTIYVVTFLDGENTKEVRYNVSDNPDAVVEEYTPEDKENLIFDAWYADEACTVKYTFGEKPTADITLYANWLKDSNDNNVLDKNETITIVTEGDGTVTVNGEAVTTYVYDSAKDEVVDIMAIPVVTEGVSSSYVSSIVVTDTAVAEIAEDGNVITANGYAADFSYTYGLKAGEGCKTVTVTFTAVPEVKNPSDVLSYYVGMDGVANEDVYNAVIANPPYDADAVTIQYLARPEGDEITIHASSLGLSDEIVSLMESMGYGSFTFQLDELWLDLNVGDMSSQIQNSVSLDTAIATYLNQDAINGMINAFNAAYNKVKESYGDSWTWYVSGIAEATAAGVEAVKADFTKIEEAIYQAAYYYGAHNFGYNDTTATEVTETIKITYTSSAMHWTTETDITLADKREATSITGSGFEVVYRDYLDEDVLTQIGAVVVDSNGNAVEGAVITCPDLAGDYTFEGKAVSDTAYELTVYYAGNDSYKPSKATFSITVVKAPAKIDVPNVVTTYGEGYSVAPTVTLGNKYGIESELTESMIQFVVGLDVADLDVGTEGVSGLNGKVQVLLPESYATILSYLGLEDGTTLNLSEVTELLNGASGLLGEYTETLNSIMTTLETITNAVEVVNLEFVVGGELPTNIGVYLYGAVTTNTNYETAYDVSYIVIAPKTEQVYLDWNYSDSNGVLTPELLQYLTTEDLGASAYNDEAFTSKNEAATELVYSLFVGIDDEGNTVYTTDGKTLGTGAYTQIAFVAEFGNETVYAKPIIRPLVIVPNTVKVEIKNADEKALDVFTHEFDNNAYELHADVTYTAGENLPDGELTLTYTGIRSNTNTYNSTEAPKHAGAYLVTATYVAKNASGDITAIGMDAATLIIKPTESTINVEDVIVEYKDVNRSIAELLEIEAGSTVEGLTPDVTIITASIASNGDFSVNGWEAIDGAVNVDFPDWVDALIQKYAPSVMDGITVGELNEKLIAKLPEITEQLQAAGISTEITDVLNQVMTEVSDVLAKVPSDVELTFTDTDTLTAKSVGAYAVVGITTDSDHIPAVDYGVLVIVPAVTEVELKWNYTDANNIFTPALLQWDVLGATAYNVDGGAKNAEATAKIEYQFIGIDANGDMIVTNTAEGLNNGAYIQLAYIPLEVGGEMTMGNLIARPVVIVPNVDDVQIVDAAGRAQNKFEFTFDNAPVELYVNVNGVRVDNEIQYVGIQTNTNSYESTTAPTHAGVYIATTTYRTEVDGVTTTVGMDAAMVTVAPAESTMKIDGTTVTYDGEGHGVSTGDVLVTAVGANVTEPDYTLISGGVTVSGDVNEIGVDALHGNVNIDFPKWLDEALATTEAFQEGVDPAYLIEFIGSYRDDLIALIPEEELITIGVAEADIDAVAEQLNGYIDELLTILDKLPEDVALTFEDDVTYTEPGYYGYFGIVTDSDHIPSYDTGLLIIEKKINRFDLLDTTVPYNGKEQWPNMVNEFNADYFAMVVDRDDYVVNFIIEDDLLYLLEDVLGVDLPESMDIAELRNTYDVDALVNALETALTQIENVELPEDVQKIVDAIKNELDSLPNAGTITINGALPVDAGDYEVYAISYSEYYQLDASQASLTIAPIYIVVDDVANSKYYGEADPELTATVSYYSYAGAETYDLETGAHAVMTVEKVEITTLPDDVKLSYEVIREEGENVGLYDMSVEDASIMDSKNYVLEVVEDDTQFEILPAEITITVADASKYYGEEDPDINYTFTVVNGDVTEEEIGLNITREVGENVGQYSYIVNYTESDNWTVTVEDSIGSLTINPIEVTVTVKNIEKYYGDETVYDYTSDLEDVAADDDAVLEITFNETKEDAGEHELTVATANVIVNGEASQNYSVTVVYENSEEEGADNAVLTIKPAEITVTVKDAEKTVGAEEDPAFEYEYAIVHGLGTLTEEEIAKYIKTLNIVVTREAATEEKPEKLYETFELSATHVNNDEDETNDNGNVTITVETATLTIGLGDYVCWNTRTGEYYEVVQLAILEALPNGDTVEMLKDSDQREKTHLLPTSGTIIIYSGVTLDLAEFALTADYVIGVDGAYLTGDVNCAKLYVDPNNIVLGEQGYTNTNGQYVLPIYAPSQNCFLFSLFVVNTNNSARGLFIDEEEETIYFQFKHQATGALNQSLLSDGASDNELSVIVHLEWEAENGTAKQDFVYNDIQVAKSTGSYDYTMTLLNYSGLEIDIDTLRVSGRVVTNSGATAFGTVWTAAMDKLS